MKSKNIFSHSLFLLVIVSSFHSKSFSQNKSKAQTIFDEQIVPLIEDGELQSCTKCHWTDFSGVKNRSSCENISCMVEQNFVDTVNFLNSHILWRMNQAFDSSHDVFEKNDIMEEIQAFQTWIYEALNSEDDNCNINSRCVDNWTYNFLYPRTEWENKSASCSDSALGVSIQDKIFPHRAKCAGCHTPNSLFGNNSFGNDSNLHYNWRAVASAWLSPDDSHLGALKTLDVLRNKKLINLENPDSSLFLLKPLPLRQGGVQHSPGGKSSMIDSLGNTEPAYADMLSWLSEYSVCSKENIVPVRFHSKNKNKHPKVFFNSLNSELIVPFGNILKPDLYLFSVEGIKITSLTPSKIQRHDFVYNLALLKLTKGVYILKTPRGEFIDKFHVNN